MKISLQAVCRTLVFALTAAFLTIPIHAQSDLTSVTGTIHDPSGAAVPNATVTIRNQSTAAERKATTSAAGVYSIPSISAGVYTIIVEAQGFEKLEESGNTFQAGLAATRDATLTVGNATETVSVTSEGAPVQADSATLGRNVETKQIRDLQLNGRNPLLLSLLKPGVNGGALGGFTFGLNNGINVNGARNQETLITQDGAVAVRTRSNGTSVGVADADTTQEVQILTANYNAEYGRASGGQIRIVTKSGTSQFHGVAYEYLRNSALDANSWSRNNDPNPDINSKAAPFRFNQFGYNVSGPIFIPGHWNKERNKLFFLFGQEYLRYRQDQQSDLNATRYVPTELMRQGNFSELLDPNNIFYGRSIQLHDPAGVPYANNVIPQAQLSPNGLGLLNAFPAPNVANSATSNYLATAPGPQDQRKDTGSVDYYPHDNHYIRFRVLNYEYNQVSPFASNYQVIPQLFNRPNQTISVNYIWNASPTLVNEFLVSASRDQVYINIDPSNGLYDRTRYGINYPFIYPDKNIPNKIPTIDLNGPFNELSGLPYPSSSKGPIYDISDNVSKIYGNHTIKVGFLFERAGQNDYDQINVQGVPGGTNNQNGRFVFQDSTLGGTGLALANAAVGRFDTYAELGTRSYTPYRGFMYEWFAQDSWKVTPKLHLDYGLRQSIIVPYYSIWRNMSVFDPRFYDPANAVQRDPATGAPIPGTGDPYNGLVIPGSGFPSSATGRVAADNGQFNNLFKGLDKSYSATHPLQGLQPRLGIAYAPNEKTAIRAGVGRFLTRLGVSDSVFLGGNPPFQPSASVSRGSVDNPGGVGQSTFPLPVTTQDPVFYNPEAWTWNAAVQRDVGFGTTLEVAYVGRRGLHGQQELNLNQLQPGTIQANDPSINPDFLRPYAGYGSIRSTNNVANSIYHGLQVDLNHRFTNGLVFGLAYTFSKSMDFGSNQRDVLPNAFDRSLQYGFSNFDHRHVMVINVIYELPFYKDKSKLTGKLLGGWQLSEVSQFQTGSPISFQTTEDTAGVGPGSGNSGDGGDGFSTRWLINGKIPQTGGFGANSQWYAVQPGVNVVEPAAGTFTNQRSRNIFYQPGFQNWNLGVFKNFNTTESQYITLRFEVFNWLNHPNWGGETGGGLDSNPLDANFGKITTKGGQRQLQLSLRYTF